MSKRSSTIISLIVGIIILTFVGCKKGNQNSLAFVGDEKDMKTCYDLYPQQYFPTTIADTVREGRFPPDIVGEYQMRGSFVDGYYEYWNQMSQQYVPAPSQAYPATKTMRLIIEDQINGKAKIRFSFNNKWYVTDAYVFGNVYSKGYPNDFIICCETSEGAGICTYFRGNIIKGTITDEGIRNIETWTVIKDREFSSLVHGIYNVGGHDHYRADLAPRTDE